MATVSTNFLLILCWDLSAVVMGPRTGWSPDDFIGPPTADLSPRRVWEGSCGKESMSWVHLMTSSPDRALVQTLNHHQNISQALDEVHPRLPPWTFYLEIEIHHGKYKPVGKYFHPVTIIRVGDKNASDIGITTAETCDLIKKNTPMVNRMFGTLNTVAVFGAERLGQTGSDIAFIEDCIKHPHYKKASESNYVSEHDIGVIKLKKLRPFTDNTKPVCMPAADEEIEPGTEVILSGWDRKSDRQKNIHVRVTRWKWCKHDFEMKIENPSSYFCIEFNESQESDWDSSDEDNDEKSPWFHSGAPVLIQRDGQYVMLGIVTLSKWQTVLADLGYERFSATVAKLSYQPYQDFIEDTIKDKSKLNCNCQTEIPHDDDVTFPVPMFNPVQVHSGNRYNRYESEEPIIYSEQVTKGMGSQLFAIVSIFVNFGLREIGHVEAAYIWRGRCGKLTSEAAWITLLRQLSISEDLSNIVSSTAYRCTAPPKMSPADVSLVHRWFITVRVRIEYRRDGGYRYFMAVLIRARDGHDVSDIAITNAKVCNDFDTRRPNAIFGLYNKRGTGTSVGQVDGCYPLKEGGSEDQPAILKLKQPVSLTDIPPACLPERNDDDIIGRPGFFLAWGSMTDLLREIGGTIGRPRVSTSSNTDHFAVDNVMAQQYMVEFGGPLFTKFQENYVVHGVYSRMLAESRQLVFTPLWPYIEDGSLEEAIKTHSVLWQPTTG